MRIDFVTTSEAETIELGRLIGARLRTGDVLGLIGELGAGKTRFVRGVASGIGVDPTIVSSPTYVLVNEYESGGPATPTLVHMDAYRLRDANELASLGWSDVADDHAVVLIEWADRIEAELPHATLRIAFHHDGDQPESRRIQLLGDDSWIARLGELPFQR